MSEQKCRKVYVPVNLDVDAEGNIRPRLIRWIDGRVYEIDRLKHKCRAASTKVLSHCRGIPLCNDFIWQHRCSTCRFLFAQVCHLRKVL